MCAGTPTATDLSVYTCILASKLAPASKVDVRRRPILAEIFAVGRLAGSVAFTIPFCEPICSGDAPSFVLTSTSFLFLTVRFILCADIAGSLLWIACALFNAARETTLDTFLLIPATTGSNLLHVMMGSGLVPITVLLLIHPLVAGAGGTATFELPFFE